MGHLGVENGPLHNLGDRRSKFSVLVLVFFVLIIRGSETIFGSIVAPVKACPSVGSKIVPIRDFAENPNLQCAPVYSSHLLIRYGRQRFKSKSPTFPISDLCKALWSPYDRVNSGRFVSAFSVIPERDVSSEKFNSSSCFALH